MSDFDCVAGRAAFVRRSRYQASGEPRGRG